jgi:prophage regulatory protein
MNECCIAACSVPTAFILREVSTRADALRRDAMSQSIKPATRILRLPELRQRCGLGTTAIYDRLNPKSKRFDPSFPKPIVLGGTQYARAVGWLEHEVECWLGVQIERSHGGSA